jgi:acylphosphatase
MIQARMFADGRVQGVNFRSYVQRFALNLGLKGYVRNLPDGRVEILVQGIEENVQKLMDYVKSNPGLSYVVKLDISWENHLSNLSNFHIEF